MGCAEGPNSLTCRRGLSSQQALAPLEQPRRLFANDYFQLGPIVDGVVVTSQPLMKFQSREARSVPLLFSSADQEAAFSLFGLMYTGPIATAEDFTAALASLAPRPIVPAIEAVYPLANFATPRQALTAGGVSVQPVTIEAVEALVQRDAGSPAAVAP